MHDSESARLAAAIVNELARAGVPEGYWLWRIHEARAALRILDRFYEDFEEALNGPESEPPPGLRPP